MAVFAHIEYTVAREKRYRKVQVKFTTFDLLRPPKSYAGRRKAIYSICVCAVCNVMFPLAINLVHKSDYFIEAFVYLCVAFSVALSNEFMCGFVFCYIVNTHYILSMGSSAWSLVFT